MIKIDDPSRDDLPEWLQERVPEELEDADVLGLETAGYDESVLMHGPPGSGKTTSIGIRVSVLCDREGLSPRDVTVVTYRTSQADVLESRLDDEWDVFGAKAEDMELPFEFWGTAHAIACRATGFHQRFEAARKNDQDHESDMAGMVTNTDPDPKREFCKEHGIQYRTDANWTTSKWEAFHSLYAYAKNNMLDVGSWRLDDSMLRGARRDESDTDAEYTDRVLTQDPRAFRKLQDFRVAWGQTASFDAVVKRWEAWKSTHTVCDFWEQLEAGIVGSLPATRLVCVDELHDATPLMACYFERLIDASETAVVAGDPDQTINAFSGSDPRIFTGLPDRVETDLPMILLPDSHRCSDEAFLAASRVLANHHSPPPVSTYGAGKIYPHGPEHTFEFDNSTGTWSLPPAGSGDSPVALWDAFGPDIMFLARTQMMVDAPAAHLDRHGVIYQSQDGVAGNWSARCTLLEMLEMVEQYRVPEQQSVVNGEFENGDGDGDDRRSVQNPETATSTTVGYSDALAMVEHTHQEYLDDARESVKADIRAMRRQEEPLTVAAFTGFVTSGFWQVYGRGKLSVDELVRINSRHGFSDRSRDVVAMRRAWERYQEESFSDGVKTLSEGTKLWTIHASKGGESDHIVVYSGITRTTEQSIKNYESDAANEARTWYVALTRSRGPVSIVRGAYDMTVDEYLPDDLVQVAALQAEDYRTATSGSDGGNRGDS